MEHCKTGNIPPLTPAVVREGENRHPDHQLNNRNELSLFDFLPWNQINDFWNEFREMLTLAGRAPNDQRQENPHHYHIQPTSVGGEFGRLCTVTIQLIFEMKYGLSPTMDERESG